MDLDIISSDVSKAIEELFGIAPVKIRSDSGGGVQHQ